VDLTDQHASPDDANVETLKAQAMQLRIAGHSYRAIGRAIGRSHTRAHELVIAALREVRTLTAERVAELRSLEAARLDDLWWKLYPKKSGDVLSADKARALARISEGRRQLFGLDLPRFIGGLGGDDTGFAEAIDLARLDTNDLRTLELLTLKAKGQGAEAFGLDPDDEIFDAVPAEGEVTGQAPLLPPGE
jgi:hypothetical protein